MATSTGGKLGVVDIRARPHGVDLGASSTALHRSTLESLEATVGGGASIAIAIPDALGRLRVVARTGWDGHGGRLRSARRREAFRTGELVEVSPGNMPDTRLAIIPLIGRGESLGVVEIVAPARLLLARLDRIKEEVDRLAARLGRVGQDADPAHSRSSESGVIELASVLLRARTNAQAVALTVETCGERLGRPMAGLLPDRSGEGWFLAATSGLGKRRVAQLRARLRERPALRTSSEATLLSGTLCSVVGADRCDVVRAGPGVLLVVAPGPENESVLAAAARLLASALTGEPHASRELSVLDVGIGWTAHEFRAPVLSARSVIDHVLEDPTNGQNQELLVRARSELGFLAELVEPLLYWAAGSGRLKRRRIDLVHLVREAVDSCVGESEHGRVSIRAPERLPARVDGAQLRCAIANLVRNALTYSPPHTPVSVTVRGKGDQARIWVRDCGPGIGPEERDEIFQPFARGRAAVRRPGQGLGLFITKRIVEAHGGSITVGSQVGTTSFCVRLPLQGRGP